MNKLTVSCVIFYPNYDILFSVLFSLAESVSAVSGWEVDVYLINNGNDVFEREACETLIRKLKSACSLNIALISGHGNIGYGAANNLVISKSDSKYHLILNPDVIVDRDCLRIGIEYLDALGDIVMLSPNSFSPNTNKMQYLCKRYPSIVVLLARFLDFGIFNRYIKKHANLYEYRTETNAGVAFEPEIVSGCFMLCRSSALKSIAGFDERFFLYFEDFDLSLRISHYGRLVFLPSMKIYHYGGGAGKKGIIHIKMFVKSAWKFYRKYRVKWY